MNIRCGHSKSSLSGMVFIVLIFLTLIEPLGTEERVLLEQQGDKIVADSYFSIRKDGEGDWFQVPETPNFGYVTEPYNLRLNLQNEDPVNATYLLVIQNATLNLVEWNLRGTGGFHSSGITGRGISPENRPFNHRFPVIPIELGAHEQAELELTIAGVSMILPTSIYPLESFMTYDRRDHLTWGIYFGLMTIMILYNFFIFLYSKDLNFAYIALFIFTFTGFMFFHNGFGHTYLPYARWIANDRIHVIFGGGFSTLITLLFAVRFLEIRKSLPSMYPWFLTLEISSVLLILYTLFAPPKSFMLYSNYIVFPAILISLLSAYLQFRKGSRDGLIYLSTWFSFLILLLPFLLKELGVIKATWFADSGIRIGSALLVTLLSLAVARKLDTIKKEKDLALIERETLKEMDRVKSDFFANVTHEFRTPLANILAALEMLPSFSDTNKSNPLDKALDIIKRNSNRSLQMVDTFLTFTKFHEGRLEKEEQLYVPGKLIRYYVGALESSARLKDLDLEFQDGTEENFILRLDGNLFESAFLNLLSNAIKFTPRGGRVEVRLEKRTLEEESHLLDIHISDTGIGIEPEKLPHIFDRFYQAEKGSSKSFEGTGLGLALAKEIIELHGGTVSVQSQPGSGSCFTLSLPLIQKDNRSEEVPHNPRIFRPYRLPGDLFSVPVPVSKGDPSDTKPVILLAEDNHDLREIIRVNLIREFSVIAVANGKEALKILEEGRNPAMIISDIMMPEMDGRTLQMELSRKESWQSIPLLFLTARASRKEKLETLEEGAVEYLYKPFEMMELMARARNILSLRMKERQNTTEALQQKVLSALEDFSHPENFSDESSAGGANLEAFDLNERERQIVEKIFLGKQDKEIASELGLSTRTVSNYLHRLYRKLKVNSRTDLLHKLRNG